MNTYRSAVTVVGWGITKFWLILQIIFGEVGFVTLVAVYMYNKEIYFFLSYIKTSYILKSSTSFAAVTNE